MIEQLDESKARLGIKIKTEKSGNTKKKNTNPNDWTNVKKKLIQYGVHEAYTKQNLVSNICDTFTHLHMDLKHPTNDHQDDPFWQEQIDSLELEFKFPKYITIYF